VKTPPFTQTQGHVAAVRKSSLERRLLEQPRVG